MRGWFFVACASTPTTDFFLNGRPLKIKGVCLHQDHAGVGVALPDALHVFRLQRLKSMGCNAIRLHHAVAPELLQACDRLGMLVMAENRLFNPAPDYVALLLQHGAAPAQSSQRVSVVAAQ